MPILLALRSDPFAKAASERDDEQANSREMDCLIVDILIWTITRYFYLPGLSLRILFISFCLRGFKY